MLTTQLFSALLFYAVYSAAAGIGLPFTSRIFHSRTMAFFTAKPAGLLLFGYAIWLLSSLKLLNYQSIPFITSLFIILALVGAFFSRQFFRSSTEIISAAKDKKHSTKQKKNYPFYLKVLIVELCTIIIYLIYLWLRSHHATINGTESFMDLALLSAAGKTHSFPFIDPWYAGKTVNYYYYGSYLMSLLSNLSHVRYTLTYNFSLGLLYSQCLVLSAVLTHQITTSKKAAALAAFLVTTAGALFFAIATLAASFANPPHVYNYFSSTRLFDPSYIINEIPSYSFTVGDLHAHLLALPFFLFALLLLYAIAKETQPRRSLMALLALSLASSGMINAWDYITIISVFGVLVIIKMLIAADVNKNYSAAKPWLFHFLGTFIASVVLMWPNLRTFHNPTLGLGYIPSFVTAHNLHNVQWPTPLIALLGLWGLFVAGVAWTFITKRLSISRTTFLSTIIIVSLGILAGVELFFIKDIYSISNPPYFRANTTFKFGYHAWVMLSIAFSALTYSLFEPNINGNGLKRRLPKLDNYRRVIGAGLISAAVIAGLFYPYESIKQFYFANTADAKTLNGMDWMKRYTPGDYDTVNFINANIHDRAVIAEAVGDSYSTYSRITTFSGMITPMGWKSHEWTWRFQGKAAEAAPIGANIETGYTAIAKVGDDIAELYKTSSRDEAATIIQQYGIKYIYVGDLEYEAYPNLQIQKFNDLGHIVFQSNGSMLFTVN